VRIPEASACTDGGTTVSDPSNSATTTVTGGVFRSSGIAMFFTPEALSTGRARLEGSARKPAGLHGIAKSSFRTARSDIQEIIAASAHHLHQLQNVLPRLAGQILALLPGTVSPGVWIDRRRSLPGFVENGRGDLVIAHHHEVALGIEYPAAHHAFRLEVVNRIREALALLRRGLPHIEPDFGKGPYRVASSSSRATLKSS